MNKISLSPFTLILLAMMCLPLLTGCGNAPVTVSLNGDMATPYHVHYTEKVYRNPPIIFVQPNAIPTEPLTALFVPLRLTQNMNHSKNISRNISRQVWQIWLSQRAFATLEYDDSVEPHRVSDALALAKRRGAKLLVGGYITHMLDSGTVGDSELSITLEIYDVASGNMLWSLAQGARLDKKHAQDFFLVGVQSRMPADPLGLISRTIAQDTGLEIYYWVNPQARKKGGYLPSFEGKPF